MVISRLSRIRVGKRYSVSVSLSLLLRTALGTEYKLLVSRVTNHDCVPGISSPRDPTVGFPPDDVSVLRVHPRTLMPSDNR